MPKQITIPFRSLLVATALCVTAVTVLSASADRSATELAPTVGLVDVESVINGAEELKTFNARLEADVNVMQTELNDLANQLKTLDADFQELAQTDREGRRAIRKKQIEVSSRAEVRKRILQNDIDTRKGEAVKSIYEKMLAAIATISQRDGIEVVLFDDRAIDIPEGLVESQVNQFIQARRVLYGSEQSDVTSRVLNLLNSNYEAGR